MTQKIKVAGPSPDFASLSAAIASLTPGVPFTEPIQIEVYSTAPQEVITIPSTLLPTSANPLIIMASGTPAVVSPFADQQLLSGSETTYPAPQPRMVPPVMGFLDVQANYVYVDCMKVEGDVVLTASSGVVLNGVLCDDGQIRVVRPVPTAVTIQISNCEVRRCGAQSAIRVVDANGVKLYHNTALIRQSDQGVPGNPVYALEVVDSAVDARNNVLAGAGANAFAIRYAGDPAPSIIRNNLYFGFDGGKAFRFENGGPVTETDLMVTWIGFMTSEASSIISDPKFRERLDPTDVDLLAAATSPVLAAAPFLSEVTHDIRGQKRPFDFVTMGAYESGEVIPDSGKRRFLEILSGISSLPVNKAMLGWSGVNSLFGEFPAKLPTDQNFDPTFTTPVDMEGAVVPGDPGHEGKIIFKAAFQQQVPIYAETLDATFDRPDEVALVSADGVPFLIKRMHRIPFDGVAFMSTQFQIPVEIVA